MVLGKGKVRVKVTLTLEVKEALQKVASRQGVSLSQLLADSAVDMWFHHRVAIERLESRIKALEGGGSDRATQSSPVVSKGDGQTRKATLGVKGGSPVITTKATQASRLVDEAIAQGSPVHLDNLLDRLGKDRGLKARLCQLGGRDGRLFRGDLGAAMKVAEVTGKLDPDGLTWLPVDSQRVYWLVINPVDYARQILTADGLRDALPDI